MPGAREQQVAYLDRRGALWRDTMHRVTTQRETAIIDVDFQHILSDCVLCRHVLLSISGSIPDTAMDCRLCCLLPDIITPIVDAALGAARHVQRMRENTAQAMAEGAAQAREKRALDI